MEKDTAVLDAANTRIEFLQGQKLPEYDHSLVLSLGYERGFPNPAHLAFCPQSFVP